MREIIESKLKKMQINGAGAHNTDITDDDQSILGFTTELHDDSKLKVS